MMRQSVYVCVRVRACVRAWCVCVCVCVCEIREVHQFEQTATPFVIVPVHHPDKKH